MVKQKRKLTTAERAAKKKRREMFMTVFINGKMKQVRRPPTVEGLPVDEFIRRNADLVWLHQNEMWELIESPELGPDSSDWPGQEEDSAGRLESNSE